jgi:hypothetical protein
VPTLKDISGQRFGRLQVLWGAGRRVSSGRARIIWACQCDCSKIVYVLKNCLISCSQVSCGCYHSEIATGKVRHGYTIGGRTPEHRAYQGAKNRCTNPNSPAWEKYGGRGIEFRFKSFEEFIAELGDKPEPKRLYSVDRIENEGHYERGNVRWATKSEQAKNRRGNVEAAARMRRAKNET